MLLLSGFVFRCKFTADGTRQIVETNLAGDFIDLRDTRPPPLCLHPDPAIGYPPGNALADIVRAHGHNGIVYPSVRHAAPRGASPAP